VTAGGVVSELSTMSEGLLLDSRLPRLIAVEVEVLSAKLKVPLPLTSRVTSTLVHCPALRGPEEPATVAEGGGALVYLIPFSVQLLSATHRTSKPTLEDVFA
jgi:hypothetical protein